MNEMKQQTTHSALVRDPRTLLRDPCSHQCSCVTSSNQLAARKTIFTSFGKTGTVTTSVQFQFCVRGFTLFPHPPSSCLRISIRTHLHNIGFPVFENEKKRERDRKQKEGSEGRTKKNGSGRSARLRSTIVVVRKSRASAQQASG